MHDERPDEGSPQLIDDEIIASILRMDKGGSLLRRLVSLYAEQGPVILRQAREAAASADGEELARHAHAMKSMSLSIGARCVVEIAGAIEEDGRAHPTPEHIESLSRAFEAAVAALGRIAQARTSDMPKVRAKA